MSHFFFGGCLVVIIPNAFYNEKHWNNKKSISAVFLNPKKSQQQQ